MADQGDHTANAASLVSMTIDNRVARITLNNPPLNVLTLDMLGAITHALHEAVREEDALCAFVFEAAPGCRAFSAGIAMEDHRSEVAYQMLDAYHGIFRNLDFYARPSVAIVGDAALGGGCEIAAFCDFVIASEKARFGLPEIKVGVFPSLACAYLQRAIGQKKARELILTGALLSAHEAKEAGLVTTVVPEDQLQTKANELLDKLRGLSAAVLEATRRALADAANAPFEEALSRVEDVYLNQLMNLKDSGEGLVAFLEKRAPKWKHK